MRHLTGLIRYAPGIKSILANEIDERKFTPIIASHNLRELEDICDHVGLLHKGGVLFIKRFRNDEV